MAHTRQKFALVGYSEDLERRPLKFVEPIPASMICSACGNIPRLTYTLLCGHVLCEPCYASCSTTSECVCPLDGEACNRDDVIRKEHKAEQLLRRQVLCWNKASGCGVVPLASQIAEHIRNDCEYHVTHCPKCSAAVLCRDICAHLKSQCATLVLHAAPEADQRTDDYEYTEFVGFERKLEQRVGELGAKLAQLCSESSTQNGKHVELCQNINDLNETLKQEFGPAAVQIVDCLNRNNANIRALVAHEKTLEQRVGELHAVAAQLSLKTDSLSDKLVEVSCNNIDLKEALAQQFKQASDRTLAEMKALYAQESESLRTALTTGLSSVPSAPKMHQWVMKGYAALMKKAVTVGWSRSLSNKVYLRRYLMSWGIDIRKEDKSLYIALCIQLHKGEKDEFLDWPFPKEVKLSIIHPETRHERHLFGKPKTGDAYNLAYAMPIESCNAPARFIASEIDSKDIERGGYVKRDQLLLRFEVLL